MSYYNENVMKLIHNIITRLPYTHKMVKYTAYNRTVPAQLTALAGSAIAAV